MENNQIEYFISKMYLSPDGRHLAIVIDLLGNKKEYVCLYKHVGDNEGQAQTGFLTTNVLFNIKPEMALRDNGTGYFIQRTEEGVYTELISCVFDSVKVSNPTPTTPSQEMTEQK